MHDFSFHAWVRTDAMRGCGPPKRAHPHERSEHPASIVEFLAYLRAQAGVNPPWASPPPRFSPPAYSSLSSTRRTLGRESERLIEERQCTACVLLCVDTKFKSFLCNSACPLLHLFLGHGISRLAGRSSGRTQSKGEVVKTFS